MWFQRFARARGSAARCPTTLVCCTSHPRGRVVRAPNPAYPRSPMADVRTTTIPEANTAPEAPPSPTHLTIRREDYRPPDWLVPELALDFDLGLETTKVRATLNVERNGSHDR